MTTTSTSQTLPPRHRRRWYQFSLRALLIFTLAAGTLSGFIGIRVQARHRQKVAAEAIVKAGGEVFYDYQCDAAGKELEKSPAQHSSWLRSLVGNELFDSVVAIRVSGDAEMKYLKDLPDLKSLHFRCGPRLTDAGMSFLRDAPQIERIWMGIHDNVTSAGLAHLEDVTQLKCLEMEYLNITDEDLARIQGLTHLRELSISSSRISDVGLGHLRQLTELEKLRVDGKFTGAGVNALKRALPKCRDCSIDEY
jgi:hypothetical protein